MTDHHALKVLLVTGQSSQYHNWRVSSARIAAILRATGIFDVEVATSPAFGEDMSGFLPVFADSAAVVIDYEGSDWPAATRQALVAYVHGGGGLVIFHATDNAFPRWPEFQELCGIGGWAGRDESSGPKVRWRDGHMILDDSPGIAMHPIKHDFRVMTRAPEHPIMAGLPSTWVQIDDELYSQLRGPAKQLEVLATACADPAIYAKATGEHEPVLMTIRHGHGRVFHTTLGHVGPTDTEAPASMHCPGFVLTLQRGTEWAATGTVANRAARWNIGANL